MNIEEFDKRVLKSCGRTTLQERAITGFYSYGDMDRAYQTYKNPIIQKKFGSGIIKSEKNVFMHSRNIGDYVGTKFGERIINLGNIDSSISEFSDDDYSNYWNFLPPDRSYSSDGSAPASMIAEAAQISDNIDQLRVLYERGVISDDEFAQSMAELRAGIRQEVEVAVDENLQPYAVREEILPPRVPLNPADPFADTQSIGTVQHTDPADIPGPSRRYDIIETQDPPPRRQPREI